MSTINEQMPLSMNDSSLPISRSLNGQGFIRMNPPILHNMAISKATSRSTGYSHRMGFVQPRFMPEGMRSGPQEFQMIMRAIFDPIKEYSIVKWNNIPVLANILKDVRDRLVKMLEICKQFKVILKMSKTQIGCTSAEFLG